MSGFTEDLMDVDEVENPAKDEDVSQMRNKFLKLSHAGSSDEESPSPDDIMNSPKDGVYIQMHKAFISSLRDLHRDSRLLVKSYVEPKENKKEASEELLQRTTQYQETLGQAKTAARNLTERLQFVFTDESGLTQSSKAWALETYGEAVAAVFKHIQEYHEALAHGLGERMPHIMEYQITIDMNALVEPMGAEVDKHRKDLKK